MILGAKGQRSRSQGQSQSAYWTYWKDLNYNRLKLQKNGLNYNHQTSPRSPRSKGQRSTSTSRSAKTHWKRSNGWRELCTLSSVNLLVLETVNPETSKWPLKVTQGRPRSPAHTFSSQVGSGSDEHCLFGSFSTAATTSSAETAEKPGNVQSVSMYSKPGRRMSATFLSKTVKVGGANIDVGRQPTTA